MKKLTILLSALCIPAVAWAHGTEILYFFVALFCIPAVLISPFLLKRLNKHIVINNKFIKFIVLLIIEIIFIFLLLIIFYCICELHYLYF